MNSRDYIKETQSQLEFHKRLSEQFRVASESLPGMSLICRHINGKPRYYCRKRGSSRQHYLGTNNPVLLQQLMMKRVASRALPAVEKNIRVLETLLFHFKCMEDHYNGIFPENDESSAASATAVSSPSAGTGEDTFRSGSAAENHPEELKHLTSFGLWVRSKSEAIIAELLYSLHIPFYYEKPLRIRGINGQWRTVYPDFTFRLPDGREIYLEHLGMMNDAQYREKVYQKLTDYFANSIYPPHNLILTMDGPDGELDIASIHNLLQALILPYFQKDSIGAPR